jgi:hypothetical protein
MRQRARRYRAVRMPSPPRGGDDGDGHCAAPVHRSVHHSAPIAGTLPVLCGEPDRRYHSQRVPGQTPGNCARCSRVVDVPRSVIQSAIAAGVELELICQVCFSDRDREVLRQQGRR